MEKERVVLSVGDVIRIEGFVMLKGLDGGRFYKVINIREDNNGNKIYDFAKGKNGKVRCTSHYVYDIDRLLYDISINNIEIIKSSKFINKEIACEYCRRNTEFRVKKYCLDSKLITADSPDYKRAKWIKERLEDIERCLDI